MREREVGTRADAEAAAAPAAGAGGAIRSASGPRCYQEYSTSHKHPRRPLHTGVWFCHAPPEECTRPTRRFQKFGETTWKTLLPDSAAEQSDWLSAIACQAQCAPVVPGACCNRAEGR